MGFYLLTLDFNWNYLRKKFFNQWYNACRYQKITHYNIPSVVCGCFFKLRWCIFCFSLSPLFFHKLGQFSTDSIEGANTQRLFMIM